MFIFKPGCLLASRSSECSGVAVHFRGNISGDWPHASQPRYTTTPTSFFESSRAYTERASGGALQARGGSKHQRLRAEPPCEGSNEKKKREREKERKGFFGTGFETIFFKFRVSRDSPVIASRGILLLSGRLHGADRHRARLLTHARTNTDISTQLDPRVQPKSFTVD